MSSVLSTDSLRKRLEDAEGDFLSIARDDASFEEFSKRWATLCEDVAKSLDINLEDQSFCAYARSSLSRVTALSENLLELQTRVHDMTASYADDLEAMLSGLSLDDIERPKSDRTRHPSTRLLAHLDDSPSPSFIASAYEWLLEHICNPYPSSATKRSLATRAGVTTRVLDDWFKSTRRHIGWVSFYKRHFHGSRSLAIAAVQCILSDDCHSADVPFEIASDFFALKSKLQNLYLAEGSSMSHTQAVRSSDCLPSVDSAFVEASKTLQDHLYITPSSMHTSDAHHADADKFISTPTPSPGRPPSLVFSSSDSEEEDRLQEYDMLNKAVVWSRALSPLSPNMDTKPFKCRRTNLGIPDTPPLSPCPSPLNTHLKFDWWSQTPDPSVPVSRKRRRSDTDSCAPTKRSRVGPISGARRPHVVSNSLPRTEVAEPTGDLEELFRSLEKTFGPPDALPDVDLSQFLAFDICDDNHNAQQLELVVCPPSVVGGTPTHRNTAFSDSSITSPLPLTVPLDESPALASAIDDMLFNLNLAACSSASAPEITRLPFVDASIFTPPYPPVELTLDDQISFGVLLQQLPETSFEHLTGGSFAHVHVRGQTA
ncbi:homeodomain transcription factor [Phlebiopsis gigantea 11061_1 CR5-6]|uniref:Homeodomain transcription factor n=1 Tax=Phlebiopsis gigantea (strain 11061_1 CR5-6) TaxID=745531 RepID=A0A0C3NC18_PHLG1|nr:homeodomain transcription factor [Phlebiopsis gigantea 11061_1 CR5-6]